MAPIHPVSIGRDERGVALVAVLLLLMLMSALAAALAVSGRTDTLVVRNHQTAAQARASAEAGLNHGVQVALAYIRSLPPQDVPNQLDVLLTTPGLLAPGLTLGASVSIDGASDRDARYEVFILDDDDPSVAGDDPDIDEDGDPFIDVNMTLVVRAVGYASNNATVTLEAVIGPVKWPAILTNGDLTISGNPDISGDEGSVHANGDLTIAGSVTVSGYATASGAYDATKSKPKIDGKSGGGNPVIVVPPISAADYRTTADFILESDGSITNQGGTLLCAAGDKGCHGGYGWTFKGGNGWDLDGDSPTAGTYYVEGAASIKGNLAPHGDKAPAVTILAEGSIDVAGPNGMDLQPAANAGGIQFVTDRDLRISSNAHLVPSLGGKMLVHEQLEISGNPDVTGQIIVEDAPSEDNLATANRIAGNPDVEYDGGLNDNNFVMYGWREVR